MHLVIITSGKFREEFREQVKTLIDRIGMFHHWEVSIKDVESFSFGLSLLGKGHKVLFRYDFLDLKDLKKCMNRFFSHVKLSGIWKEFEKQNRGLGKRLRRIRQEATPDTLLVEEFHFDLKGQGQSDDAGLVFSPLDQSVMRKGARKSQAQCSLFHPQYRSAIHVTQDGRLYPCHLPRFKKACEPLGNVDDMRFLESYRERLKRFKEELEKWQKSACLPGGVCVEGCKGKICL
jgi:hypothetical protein